MKLRHIIPSISRNKIFIGLNNIASVFDDLDYGFNYIGYKSLSVSRFLHESPIIKSSEDLNIPLLKNYGPDRTWRPNRIMIPFRDWWDSKVENYVFNKAISECDIFLFISSTFKDDYSDLKILKDLGKTVIVVFVGDDVRWYHAMHQEFERYKMMPIEYADPSIMEEETFLNRISRLNAVEKYANYIFSRVDQAQLELRPYYRWNMIVNVSTIKHSPFQRAVPLVVHAPSDKSVKGTKYLLEAVGELQSEGIAFDFKLIENVPNAMAIEMYQTADILVDQLFAPGAGKLSSEAMASGTIVMSNMSYDRYPQKNPKDCPIIDVNPKNIKSELKRVILDIEFRKQQVQLSRPYVEKYLDVKVFCKKVIDLAQGHEIPFDYIPDFYRKHYNPQSESEKAILNNRNNILREESWYKHYVKSGVRNGIVF